MVPLSDAAARPVVVSSPKHAKPESAAQAIGRSAVPEPGVVGYQRVWRDVDLVYEVRSDGLKEDIHVLSPRARASYPFEVRGATIKTDAEGGLYFAGDLGRRFTVPAPTVLGANGADLTEASGVRYEVGNADEDGSQHLEVALDPDWLREQPDAVFPLIVDPTLTLVQADSYYRVNDRGAVSNASPARVGSENGIHRRSAVHFPYESYLDNGYRVYFAYMQLVEQTGSYSAATTINSFDQGTRGGYNWGFSEIGDGPAIGSKSSPPSGVFMYPALTVDKWFALNLPDRWFGLRGTESPTTNTLRNYLGQLTVDLFKPPAPSRITNLTSKQVLTTTTPTLRAHAVALSTESWPGQDGGDPMYDFQITTAPTPGTGVAVSSGRIHQQDGQPPPTWTVPQGALQEGITYYAWVLTDWYGNLSFYNPDGVGARPTVPPASWAVPFSVKLGLGEGGPSPTDQVGAVPGQTSTPSEGAPNPSLPPSKVTVNLVDGNASVSVGTPQLETVSGGAGLRFTYNSLAASITDVKGLRASFYTDANNNGVIDVGTDPLVGERIDPTVSFDIGSAQRLVAGQDPHRALAEWNGFVTLPSGSWKLGAISSDGIKITSGSDVLLDDYASHAPNAAPKFGSSFSGGSAKPIRIVWHHESSSRQVAQVYAQDSGGTSYALSPDWLTRAPKVLPAGWVLNAAATSGRWVGLADRGTAVTVYAGDGTGYEFTAVGDGAYTPPAEAPNDLLRTPGDGTFVLSSGNLTYTFGATGALTSLVTSADDLHPAALEYGYAGSPLQLRTITDQVRCAGASPCPDSSRLTLSYG